MPQGEDDKKDDNVTDIKSKPIGIIIPPPDIRSKLIFKRY